MGNEFSVPTVGPAQVDSSLITIDNLVDYIRFAAIRRWIREPYDWQLRLTVAQINGRDAIVIAPTGGGKSLPIILPLLATDRRDGDWALCLSPLIALQDLQVSKRLLDLFHSRLTRLRSRQLPFALWVSKL